MYKWELIKNDKGQIVRYQLGAKVYITKDYDTGYEWNQKISLYIDGELIKESFTRGGYRLTDLKKMGEKWAKENPQKNRVRNLEVW